MSIEVDVPVEIEDYKEKIIFGLSLRQLCCLSLAIVLSIVSYLLCTQILKMTMDAASYVIIIEALPLMALGFIRKDGQPFEKYIKLMIRHRLGIHKLPAAVQLDDTMITSEERNKTNGSKTISKSNNREAVIFFPNSKEVKKSHRKGTKSKIKAAQKASRAAKRAAKKAAQETAGT